jgi:IPT/TIG domain
MAVMQVIYGPLKGQRIEMPDADAAAAIADGWAIDPHAPPIDPPFDVTVRENADRVHAAAHAGAAKLRAAEATPPTPPPLVVRSLTPSQATIGDPDVEMHVAGEGFTSACVITFNGGDEPTTFKSDTELTTIVKPSTATTPGSYPVTVKRGAEESEPLGFTFLEQDEQAGGMRAAARSSRFSTPRR